MTVVDVNRTKLRALGFDWDLLAGGKPSSVADHIDVKPGSSNWNGFVQALKQYDMGTVISEPVVTTLSGRPAQFSIGEGAVKLDVVPIVLGSGRIQVEHRWQLSHSGRELKSESTVEVAVRVAASVADKAILENRAVGMTINAHRTAVLPADRGSRGRLCHPASCHSSTICALQALRLWRVFWTWSCAFHR